MHTKTTWLALVAALVLLVVVVASCGDDDKGEIATMKAIGDDTRWDARRW